MQHSTVSYRSNKMAAESRRAVGSSNYSTMQQQQIEDLQRKVDMILMHNSKLLEENADLKRLVEEARMGGRKYASESSSDIYMLRKQLQLRNQEIEQLTRKEVYEKESIAEQLDQLNLVIRNLNANYHQLQIQKEELEMRLLQEEQQQEKRINMLREQFQNEIYENSLKNQLEHKEELREREKSLMRELEDKQKQWEDERTSLQERSMEKIIALEENFNKQKESLRKELQDEFSLNLRKLQQVADQKCRDMRDKSESYLRTVLESHKRNDEDETNSLKEEIDVLRRSLESRQKVIEGLLLTEPSSGGQSDRYYREVQDLRQRIKELTESHFKESELLKVKMALQHDVECREMTGVYEDRIDVLTERIKQLEDENSRVREIFEGEIRSKMKQRQKFEVDVSKLKNVIRKMKIELEGYGKELRLNIEGMKSQANSFSMSVLTELGQQKNKKNFYDEQMRKMRGIIDMKDQEMEEIMGHCEEKIKYYEQRTEASKNRMEDYKSQLEERELTTRAELQRIRDETRQEIEKQRLHWLSLKEDLERELNDLRADYESLETNLRLSEGEHKRLENSLADREKQLEDARAHIEALKIEMDMLGQTQYQETVLIPLKEHYERIISQLNKDKALLQEQNSAQAEQMGKLVSKYKVLEKSLETTVSSMKKRTELERRVMELGSDTNLTKNLAELFGREEPR